MTAPKPPPAAGPPPPPGGVLRQWRMADLRGAARLATQATQGVTHIVEGIHQSVLGTLGVPGGTEPGRTRGLTGLVYRGIYGATGLVDAALQGALLRLEPWLPSPQDAAAKAAPQRQAVLAALNGVMGDRLAQDANPLAIPMGLYQHGQPLDVAALHARGGATGKVLLLVHGLCMNDLQWQRAGHDHGQHLARALGYTPVYVRYNSGLHTSVNGRALAGLIDTLLADWPVPVQTCAVLAHSMGGLVVRSACHQGRQAGQHWPQQLGPIVFLGTPHHGAPLERAGHWLQLLLGSTPYSRPLVRLGQLRSAGITDLRHGHVLDADWQGRSRFQSGADLRQPLPLPEGVACYAIAATLARQRSPLAERLVGDGLVPLRSALGLHDDPARTLAFAPDHQRVLHGLGHLALLSDARVARQLVQWLATPGP